MRKMLYGVLRYREPFGPSGRFPLTRPLHFGQRILTDTTWTVYREYPAAVRTNDPEHSLSVVRCAEPSTCKN